MTEAGRLPWQRPMRGRRCAARLTRAQSPTRWGRCELRAGHEGEAHALDYGMSVLRWDDPRVWDSNDTAGQRPVDERTTPR